MECRYWGMEEAAMGITTPEICKWASYWLNIESFQPITRVDVLELINVCYFLLIGIVIKTI